MIADDAFEQSPRPTLIQLLSLQSMSSAQSFFLAMAMHPEVQSKAQAELDAVIGPHRLPCYADRGSLPYIDALMKESLRWQPVLPLGVAHRSTTDDEYRGWFIPKGTLVIPNAWYVLRCHL